MNQYWNNALKGLISVLIAILFLWLAVRSIPVSDLQELWPSIRYSWLLYFLPVTLLSLWLRAERWKLLTEHDNMVSSRRNLFAGVMYGFAVNYAVPRLGEFTRCFYLAKKEQKSVAAVMGTVVLERIIDVVVMLVLLLIVFFFLLSDQRLLLVLMGMDEPTNWVNFYLKLILFGLLLLLALFTMWYLFGLMASKSDKIGSFHSKVSMVLSHFKEGLFSIRTIKKPIFFFVLTIGIWLCYILMTLIPFGFIEGGVLSGLGLKEALVITVVSAVGVVIPSPGGIGTYHLLVQQGLHLLYQIPEATGFAYALISHASVMMIILITTPLALLFAAKRTIKPL